MSYQDRLRDAFHKGGIEHVAIIDDGYDAPSAERLAPQDKATFRTHLRDAIEDEDPDGLGNSFHENGMGSLEETLDRIEDDEHLRLLWKAYKGTERATPLGTILHRLFGSYDVDRRDKLAALESLERLITDISGKPPKLFDSQAQAKELIEFDLVFLDFYLEAPQAPEGTETVPASVAARDRSMAFLREIVEANPRRIPLVMLISSEAQAADLPEFRRHTAILASAIQFLPKKNIETDTMYAQAALLGLVIRRREVSALWELINIWRGSVQAAQDDLLNVVRELDLPDYSYLQQFRLTNERLPLAHYLVWLFNGYLSSLVERQLHDVSAARLVGSLALTDAVPGRVAPTEAISTLYGAITTSVVPMELTDFSPKAWAGDLFVRVDKLRSINGEAAAADPVPDKPMPDILAVVTPACDLVPERSANLRAVTTIGGTLHELEAATHPTTHFVLINDRRFHVTWHPKWPVTIPVEDLTGGTALGGRYKWVGRLRELYHADLQQMFTKDIGRVGLPVVPTLPHWAGLRILAKVEGKFEEVQSYATADRAVWLFFNAKDKADVVLHLREDVAWNVRSWVRKRLEGKGDKNSLKLMAKVDQSEFVEALQMPVALRRDACDLPTGVRIKKGDPDVHSETGAGCDLSILMVFGNDRKAAPEAAVETPVVAPAS
ncbi:hypothetical protein [Methylobacterium sp. D54C]